MSKSWACLQVKIVILDKISIKMLVRVGSYCELDWQQWLKGMIARNWSLEKQNLKVPRRTNNLFQRQHVTETWVHVYDQTKIYRKPRCLGKQCDSCCWKPPFSARYSVFNVGCNNGKEKGIFDCECNLDKPLGARGGINTDLVMELKEKEGTKDATRVVRPQLAGRGDIDHKSGLERDRHKRLSGRMESYDLRLI